MDPRQLDVMAIVQKASMTQMQRDRAISAYRNNIALPDVHIAQLGSVGPVDSVGQDGQPMTFARRQELMRGKQTYLERGPDAPRPDIEIETEEYGKSDIDRRPGMRKVTPVEMTEELMAQRLPADCLWTSGSDACAEASDLRTYVQMALEVLDQSNAPAIRVVLSNSGADTLAYILRKHMDEDLTPALQRLLQLPRTLDDTQHHHLQIWGDGFPRVYTSVFLNRGLMSQIQQRKDWEKSSAVDVDADTKIMQQPEA